MKNKKLQTEFLNAVSYVNDYNDPLPADFLLNLYAYYKIASKNSESPGSKTPLINAFKANALIQVKNMTPEEAMEKYIEMVNDIKNK
ncbi:acyl-CoA-binding protein [Cellulophaga baltica]|uniref:acyl-CoA-binding protein n=1 Tax=Cellulophaga TaxID=104264 RepID=UPI001C07BB78|nr:MULTISPECIES: acyl-CoA-binding protein [Cellulophaga]MBU2994982.1 acyl-CoA-binding protein [Cellulophaga baltica]MDO6766377.1 acyl-CoA-binding protein [Cellulophaga sp. 1_MG-2023]